MPIFLIGVDTEGIGIGDRLSWVWRSDVYQNIIVIVLLVAVVWLIRYAARQEHWRNAARQIRGNRLAMVCLFILLGYLLIGVLDSIDLARPVDTSVGSDAHPKRERMPLFINREA